jgi:hypothetical protein
MDNDVPFYYNLATGKSTWKRPTGYDVDHSSEPQQLSVYDNGSSFVDADGSIVQYFSARFSQSQPPSGQGSTRRSAAPPPRLEDVVAADDTRGGDSDRRPRGSTRSAVSSGDGGGAGDGVRPDAREDWEGSDAGPRDEASPSTSRRFTPLGSAGDAHSSRSQGLPLTVPPAPRR